MKFQNFGYCSLCSNREACHRDNWAITFDLNGDTCDNLAIDEENLLKHASFKDGQCPRCGGETHAINDEPMHCDDCGWVEQKEIRSHSGMEAKADG